MLKPCVFEAAFRSSVVRATFAPLNRTRQSAKTKFVPKLFLHVIRLSWLLLTVGHPSYDHTLHFLLSAVHPMIIHVLCRPAP
jgi:hypothetical protein